MTKNGYDQNGITTVKATEGSASDYMMPDEQPATKSPDTSAYTTPEDNLVDIVPVGLGAITVRPRPPRDDWFRTHPDGAFSTGMTLVRGKMGDLYAVRRELIPVAGPEVQKRLVKASVSACMTVDGQKFLWAIIHPAGDANQQHFDNMLSARDLSRSKWIQFFWDKNQESHVAITAKQQPPEPKWPEGFTLVDWIDKAFKGKFIDDPDHRLFKKFRGELV